MEVTRMKKTIAKVLVIMALLAVLSLVTGCTAIYNESVSSEAEAVHDTISAFYGQWNITDIYQIPYVSDCLPDDALKEEGESVLLDAELFEAATTIIKPEYEFKNYSCEELESIGIYNCSQDAALSNGADVIGICDVNTNYEQCYLVVLDTTSMLYVKPNGYVFSLEKAE